jgi:hypothetical protein
MSGSRGVKMFKVTSSRVGEDRNYRETLSVPYGGTVQHRPERVDDDRNDPMGGGNDAAGAGAAPTWEGR